MKNKNIFTRAISLAVMLAMLILSAVAVSAADWTAPKVSFEPLKNPAAFTDKDAAKLSEALSGANLLCNIFSIEDYKKTDPEFDPSVYEDGRCYSNIEYVELAHVDYEFIKEKDYEVRRVELKHGYYIDIVFASQKNNGVSSAYIRNRDGYVIAEMILTANFTVEGTKAKTVKGVSQVITGKSYVSQITFTDKYSRGGFEKSNITFTDAAITLKIKDGKNKEIGKYRYNAQVTCDIYGDTVSYFSYEKPYEQLNMIVIEEKDGKSYSTTAPLNKISFDAPQGSQIFLKDTAKFTDKDASKLTEALSSIDYGKYELIRGSNYEIKRVELKYGYYIEIVYDLSNDYLTSDDGYNTNRDGYFVRSAGLSIRVCDSNGYILANMQLNGSFFPVLLDGSKGEAGYTFKTGANDTGVKTKSSAGIFNHNAFTGESDAAPQIFLSGKSRGIENATDSSSIVDAVFTLEIKNGAKTKKFIFNAQIECYYNGLMTAWVK